MLACQCLLTAKYVMVHLLCINTFKQEAKAGQTMSLALLNWIIYMMVVCEDFDNYEINTQMYWRHIYRIFQTICVSWKLANIIYIFILKALN